MRRAARHGRGRTVPWTIAGTSFSPSRPDGMGRKGPVSVQSAWVYPRRRHRIARRPARVRWPICRRPSSSNAGASSRASRRPSCSTHAVRCWLCSSRARLSRPSSRQSPPGMMAGVAVARRADPPSPHRAAHRLIAGGIRQRSESSSGHNAVALRTRRLNRKVECDAQSGAGGATIVRTRAAHQARVVSAPPSFASQSASVARPAASIPWVGDTGGLGGGLAAATKKSGLPHVHPHRPRHSAAVRQAEAGVPMEEIASDLGHSKPEHDRRDLCADLAGSFEQRGCRVRARQRSESRSKGRVGPRRVRRTRSRFSEPAMTFPVGRRSGKNQCHQSVNGGDDRDRTCDLSHVKGMHYRCATSPHRPRSGSPNLDAIEIVHVSQRLMRSAAYPVKVVLSR